MSIAADAPGSSSSSVGTACSFTVRGELQDLRNVHCDLEPRAKTNAWVLPLPKGEGWGEGEGIVRQSIAREATRPAVHGDSQPSRNAHSNHLKFGHWSLGFGAFEP